MWVIPVPDDRGTSLYLRARQVDLADAAEGDDAIVARARLLAFDMLAERQAGQVLAGCRG